MYCTKCGKETKENDLFCSNCGNKSASEVETSSIAEIKSETVIIEICRVCNKEKSKLLKDDIETGKSVCISCVKKSGSCPNYNTKLKTKYAWIKRLSENDTILREKMTLFWANVFVCRGNNIIHTQQYHNVLRENSLGDFRNFVEAVSKEASMIKYLNLNRNVKKNPNENFARELMELFTLGVGNYKEKDIKESARAFTGNNFNKDGTFNLKKKRQDIDSKTFFGKTGNFNGDDIIDIIKNKNSVQNLFAQKFINILSILKSMRID
jgi:uncharacterized protein (DUF1800 family)